MPIYEYFCPDNNRIYSFYARTLEQGKTVPACPDNPDFRMVKLMSTFAISGAERKSATSGGKSPGGEGEDGGEGPDGDDPRMMAAMAEMEKEMAALDTDNPDPRLMGKMMRKMADLTGEKMDEGTEEMVRKLEEGADPDQLEEEFGDLLGEDGGDAPGGFGGGFGGGYGGGPPTRDPHLYDY